MQHTTNYNFNIVEGSDVVNPLVDLNPNFTSLDSVIFQNQNRTIQEATEVYSGGIHAIVCTLPAGATFFHFTATSNFTVGDKFTFNGESVTAFMPDGTSLLTGAFTINSEVLCSVVGTRMVVYTNSQINVGPTTPAGFTNGQFIYQNAGKLASKEITPNTIGAVSPYKAGDNVNYGTFIGCGRVTTANVVFILPMARPVTANSVVVSGNITLRDVSGGILVTSADFSTAGTIDSQCIRLTVPITYEITPTNYSLASVFITSLNLNFS